MDEKSILTILEEFKAILNEEKELLIHNDGKRLEEIVAQKETYIEAFEQAEITDSEKETAKKLITDIQNLQETNLTLTKQAINFGNTVIEGLQKNRMKKPVTYSKKGNDKKVKGSGFLDQSL